MEIFDQKSGNMSGIFFGTKVEHVDTFSRFHYDETRPDEMISHLTLANRYNKHCTFHRNFRCDSTQQFFLLRVVRLKDAFFNSKHKTIFHVFIFVLFNEVSNICTWLSPLEEDYFITLF